jgi:hypothetical protein
MAFEPTREGQLTEDKLKWGYWWVTHKVQVRKWFAMFLVVVDLVLCGFAIFGFADWFFGSGERERAQIAALARPVIDYEFFRQKSAPKPPQFDKATVLNAGDKTYDYFAKSANPNVLWWVEFEYRFKSGSVETPTKKGFLLPGETRSMHALGVKSDVRPTTAEFIVENVVWHRVNLHETRPDSATWANVRLNFLVSDVKFVPPAPTDPIAVSRATFTLTNDTGFGYYNVGFFITLYSGSRVVGVNRIVISDLRPGDRRTVEASWFFDLPTVSKVEVKPEVNIFDDRVYIPPGK